MMQRLDTLPKTMGLNLQPKFFFPHHWNREENMHLKLDHLPSRKHYNPESFNTKKREEFEKYYSENCNKEFLLSDALKEYCGMNHHLF